MPTRVHLARTPRLLPALTALAVGTATLVAFAPAALAAGPPSSEGSQTFYVDASTAGADGVFADSGFRLLPGLPVTVTATGTGLVEPGFPTGPNGAYGACGNYASPTNVCPLNTAPDGSLVAQAGTATPVFVGAGPTTLTGDGALTFAYNEPEQYYVDNSGGFTVTITYPCQPGNGNGDTNHYHCGPPGQQ